MPPITDSCEQCGAANRAHANFCVGCAAQLPGFAPTGPSGLELVLEKQHTRAARPKKHAPEHGSDCMPPGMWLRRLFVGGVLLMGLFIAWYLLVVDRATAPAAGPARTSVVQQRPAFVQLAPFQTEANALPGVSDAARAAAARTADAQASHRGTPNVQLPESALDTVARFYQALSSGDGAAATSHVIAPKRVEGPLSGHAMSSFYGSLQEPLDLHSLRHVNKNVVEARYSYRATRTACDGRALVTVTAGYPVSIRSIAANC